MSGLQDLASRSLLFDLSGCLSETTLSTFPLPETGNLEEQTGPCGAKFPSIMEENSNEKTRFALGKRVMQ